MRLLEHENILTLGGRDFLSEIYCAQAMVQKHDDFLAYMFFYRAVLKLARRADEILWKGLPAWNNGIRSSVAHIREILEPCRDICMPYARGRSDIHTQGSKKLLAQKHITAIVKQAEKLYDSLPAYLYPAAMLRTIVSWAHVRGHGAKKIVIFESAETLQDSSANALLKVLEEPPENVFFIFITTRASAMLPTILSRVWVEHFPPRSREEEKDILKKIFRDEKASLHTKRLADFLAQFKKSKTIAGDIRNYAQQYFTASVENKPFTDELTAFLKNSAQSKREIQEFLQALQGVLHSVLVGTAMPPQIISDFSQECMKATRKITIQNGAPATVLESLYYVFSKKAQRYNYEQLSSCCTH